MKYAMVALLVIALTFTAAAESLSAAVTEPTNSYYYVSNCRMGGGDGPSQVDVKFLVNNNWNVPMTVRYDYFDYGTDSWVEGTTQACTVGANLPEANCIVQAPLILGGRGNGTISDAVFIRLKGFDPTGQRDTITKEFSFKFEHFSTDSENNAIKKMADLTALLAKLEGAGTCGATAEEVSSAQSSLASAAVALKACDLKNAYNLPANSLKSLEKYTDASISACKTSAPAAPSQPAAQPEQVVPTPAGSTPASPISSPAAQAAQPAQQGGSMCAIGLALPLLGLFALWRRSV